MDQINYATIMLMHIWVDGWNMKMTSSTSLHQVYFQGFKPDRFPPPHYTLHCLIWFHQVQQLDRFTPSSHLIICCILPLGEMLGRTAPPAVQLDFTPKCLGIEVTLLGICMIPHSKPRLIYAQYWHPNSRLSSITLTLEKSPHGVTSPFFPC